MLNNRARVVQTPVESPAMQARECRELLRGVSRRRRAGYAGRDVAKKVDRLWSNSEPGAKQSEEISPSVPDRICKGSRKTAIGTVSRPRPGKLKFFGCVSRTPKVACKLSREKNGQEQEQLVTSSAKRRTGCESLDSRHRSIPLLLPAADRYGDVTARDRSSTRFSDGSGSVDGSGGKVDDTTFYGEAITPVNPAVFK